MNFKYQIQNWKKEIVLTSVNNIRNVTTYGRLGDVVSLGDQIIVVEASSWTYFGFYLGLSKSNRTTLLVPNLDVDGKVTFQILQNKFKPIKARWVEDLESPLLIPSLNLLREIKEAFERNDKDFTIFES